MIEGLVRAAGAGDDAARQELTAADPMRLADQLGLLFDSGVLWPPLVPRRDG